MHKGGGFLRSTSLIAVLSVAALGLSAPPSAAAQAPDPAAPTAAAPAAAAQPAPSTSRPVAVPEAQRPAMLGAGWKSSSDRAWTTTGDGDGLHLLLADASAGYAWRTVATLSEPQVEADQWIGNVCLTGSGRRAVVAYAPRTFTNKPVLFDRGALTAIVDLETGAVRKLKVRSSLAYFNPSCGAGEQVVLTQAGDTDLGRTRLIELDAATGAVGAGIEVPGQLTSPVPTPAGIVAADSGGLVRVDPSGKRRLLAPARGVPFRVAADAQGGVVYMEQSGPEAAAVRRVDARAGRPATPTTLATGALKGVQVTSGHGGRVFVTGAGRTAAVNPSVSLLAVPAGAEVSTNGELAVTSVLRSEQVDPRAPVANPAAPQPVTIAATALATGKPLTFASVATGSGNPSARALSPALAAGPAARSTAPAGARALGSPSDPSSTAERYCSVPRNDPRNQAMQPKPRQVEWAVDQAVRGVLTVARPANWKNLGMPAYTPQGLFPPLPLVGGGVVPAQVMLGIAAQESNMWQAARFAVPGMTANPLIGNYYGLDIYNSTEADDWSVVWSKADCGYGVTQVTDGMRLKGREKPGETALAYETQRAVALDFAANVAAGLRILQDKWNQTRRANMIINNGDPAKVENWFYALWAYNSGFYPNKGDGSPWGVGWANNPANPKYPAGRDAFLDKTYRDASHPQDWPYPEKVLGWAGHPVEILEAPDKLVAGFIPATWPGGPVQGPINRTNVKPPNHQFCDVSNKCEFGKLYEPNAPGMENEPAGPCASKDSQGRYDLHCWYHNSSSWKLTCASTCGTEQLRFDPGYAYQEDGTAYPPVCAVSGLPAGAQVIDNVPSWTPVVRPNCPVTWTNRGQFTFDWTPDDNGHYPGKIDTHQIGVGFGGHLWMTNAQATSGNGLLKTTGTWKWDTAHSGYGRIYVHLPEIGAGDAATQYKIKTAHGWRTSTVRQKGTGNRWVSLGVFKFNDRPEVQLTNMAVDGNGSKRVAFDAAAFAPVGSMATVKTLHWNLAGAATNNGDYDVVDRLVTEVLARQPDVITMNEICFNQFDNLRGKLTSAGYRVEGHFTTSQDSDDLNFSCFNAGDFRFSVGAAILVRGTHVKGQHYVFKEDNKLSEGPHVPLQYQRIVSCLTTRLNGTTADTKVCTTHLEQEQEEEPNPLREAEEQTRELARVFGPEAQQMPFILTGDLNIPPKGVDNAALATLYNAPAGNGMFNEVDAERGCVTSPQCQPAQGGAHTQRGRGGQKLDYIFADRWHFYIPPGRVSVNTDVGLCGAEPKYACSDHYLFYAEMMIPR